MEINALAECVASFYISTDPYEWGSNLVPPTKENLLVFCKYLLSSEEGVRIVLRNIEDWGRFLECGGDANPYTTLITEIKEVYREYQIKTLEPELALIQNKKVRSLVERVLRKVPDGFFIDAASSSGKYHPAFSLGEGGLVRHTKAAVWFARQRLWITGHPLAGQSDVIYGAILLHDSAKRGLKWESPYRHEHPLLVIKYLSAAEMDHEEIGIWSEINTLIRTHMGQFTTSPHSEFVLPPIRTSAQLFVHECDYLASKKELVGLDIFEPQKGEMTYGNEKKEGNTHS